ncbi:(2Fe-2S)-binding protein [Trichothermofontia sichuanensis]|uniref:(2Fe-2S)-binding protein n=1 Tax=Trichothermofontia sichuanensis TaxID=3045816 RepID=UPI0028F41A9C|nr:(2Fe-2S)-binding protein [Trichothermofontia sichuanensis]
MYVCICNPVTDTQVLQAIESGCRSLDDLQAKLGVASMCGRCSEYAIGILERVALGETTENRSKV